MAIPKGDSSKSILNFSSEGSIFGIFSITISYPLQNINIITYSTTICIKVISYKDI